jgi:hypothetical protein
MQEIPFDPTQINTIVMLSFETDTSRPRSVVPIYFIHTLDHPFCANPYCECHQNQSQIAVLLEAIRAGEMTLHEAANFADGRTI